MNSVKTENQVCDVIGKQANRILSSSLASHYSHLLEADVDIDPRIEAFWFAGGLDLHDGIIRGRKKNYWHEVLNDPADRALQYIGHPVLQLRHKFPLKEIIPLSECEKEELDVPEFKFDPRTQGHSMQRRHGTNIPGFWPGDANEFGLVSYHKRGFLMGRHGDDQIEALRTQAIYANWGWLLGQACHQGESCFIQFP